MSVDPKAMRATVRRDRASGKVARYRARTVLSACDLAERHNRHIPGPDQSTMFMGLGELRPALIDPVDGDGDWFFVHEVLDLTGATPEQWHRLHDEEIAEAAEEPPVLPRVDEYTQHSADGGSHQVPVCNWQMAMMLALDGPWGEELMTNAMPALRRALVETGLGDELEAVRLDEDGTVHQTGETLTDVILADGPLPSAEVVREQIRRGPLGALDMDRGQQ
ncbi:hypothetical protein TPA0906_34490 [Streptomyces olivaceus]|uniref:hypothetical protein n=1 Tax=Streptomyces olivaceus TaxID=47716 RepID=UPI0022ED8075|nr:hypothetical protein [Streptomyces olivaceus]GHJ01584.1 hypothetical protein TPA0906_34490 [Streptomyces olivaceus]